MKIVFVRLDSRKIENEIADFIKIKYKNNKDFQRYFI